MRAFVTRHERLSVGLVLLLGLLVRLPTVPVDIQAVHDVRWFIDWGRTARDLGFPAVSANIPDGVGLYPPLSLWILDLLATVEALVPASLRGGDTLLISMIKLLPVAADLCLAALIAWLVRGRGPVTAVVGAAAIALNPAFIYLGAAWGQIDSLYSLLLVISTALLARSTTTSSVAGAWVAWVLAALVKVQGLLLLPLVLVVSLRDAGWRRAAIGAVLALLVIVLLCLPWLPHDLRRYIETISRVDPRRERAGDDGNGIRKSLAFNLPVLDAMLREPTTRAIYLYPTKALRKIRLEARGLPASRACGRRSTTVTRRPSAVGRSEGWANVILTNPDMLHVGVLPRHDLWGDVLHNLRYVVVDEAHVYRGVFGSHVANVLRRLRRLARIYGAEPQFLLASATIANPGELARSLLGMEATVVGDDAAPRAERTIALWNPPLLDPELGLRASALGEASRLLAALVGRGLRTICFAKSRKSAELIHRFAADRLDAATPGASPPTAPAIHRSNGARSSGGSSRATCSASPPPTRSSSGSTSATSTARSPSASPAPSPACASNGAEPGAAGTDWPSSSPPRTRSTSTSCASPRPCSAAASRLRSSTTRTRACWTATSPPPRSRRRWTRVTPRRSAPRRSSARRHVPELRHTPRGWVWAGKETPAARIPLRSTSPDAFTVIDATTGTVLGLAELERAYATVHEGAVYLHLGRQYSSASSTCRRGARSSSRSRATGTRR